MAWASWASWSPEPRRPQKDILQLRPSVRLPGILHLSCPCSVQSQVNNPRRHFDKQETPLSRKTLPIKAKKYSLVKHSLLCLQLLSRFVSVFLCFFWLCFSLVVIYLAMFGYHNVITNWRHGKHSEQLLIYNDF